MSKCICGVWVCKPKHRAGQECACRRDMEEDLWLGIYVYVAFMDLGICTRCVTQRCNVAVKGHGL